MSCQPKAKGTQREEGEGGEGLLGPKQAKVQEGEKRRGGTEGGKTR